MSRQLEQTLLSLMPTFGSELPSSLVDLASSLVAQSQHKASTLKAEEQVARQYACANIACDRLKTTLDLPPIEPCPPIPPRAYKRLYTYLDNILPSSSTTPRSSRSSRLRTPSRKKLEENTPTKSLPSRATPSRDASLAQFRTPTKARGAAASATRAKKTGPQGSANRLSPWVQPVIRHVCTASDQRKLAPTVLAGMEYILLPEGRPAQDAWVCDHVTDLVAALYFFVTMRVRFLASGAEMDPEQYVPIRKKILGLLSRAHQEVTVSGSDDSFEAWEGWRDIKFRDFDAAVAKVNENDWLRGDWYDGIVDVVDSTGKGDAEEAEEAHEAHEGSQAPLPTGRADSMLQDRYNYLSEARRAEYATWRDAMLAKIARAVPVDSAMEDLDDT